jgi:hypothetical protein
MMSKQHWVAFFLVPVLLANGLMISRAEESCLPGPNAPTPPGAHWYYRTDPNSQKKCWHLRTEGQGGEQPGQAEQHMISEATATPPLPRPAPEALRQHSSGVPITPPPTGTSVTGTADNSAQNPAGPGDAVVAWPSPTAPATNSGVFGDAPMGTITATAPSPTSPSNIMEQPGDQPLAADERTIGSENEPNARPVLQRQASDDVKPEKDFSVAGSKPSYKAISLAMLIIFTVSFIFVGIVLNRTLAKLRNAVMGEAPLRFQVETPQTSEGPLGELLQIMQHEPNKGPRSILTR